MQVGRRPASRGDAHLHQQIGAAGLLGIGGEVKLVAPDLQPPFALDHGSPSAGSPAGRSIREFHTTRWVRDQAM